MYDDVYHNIHDYIYMIIYICICIDLSLDITHMLPLYIIIHVTDLEFAQGTPPKIFPIDSPNSRFPIGKK